MIGLLLFLEDLDGPLEGAVDARCRCCSLKFLFVR